MKKEICNECGKNVQLGNGAFVNRVVDLSSLEDRKEMGKPYPDGEFICADCDYEINQQLK